MSDQLFPEGLSVDTQDRIKGLAAKVHNKDVAELTKKDIQLAMAMDASMIPAKMNISAAQTRPTTVKFATNNYYAAVELDLSEMKTLLLQQLGESNGTTAESIENYLSAKSAMLSLMKIKHEGMENYLRDLLDEAARKDDCPVVGRNAQ